MHAFTCTLNPPRIGFGAGSVARLADELRAAGHGWALILGTPVQRDAAEALPLLLAAPRDGAARAQALYGAWRRGPRGDRPVLKPPAARPQRDPHAAGPRLGGRAPAMRRHP